MRSASQFENGCGTELGTGLAIGLKTRPEYDVTDTRHRYTSQTLSKNDVSRDIDRRILAARKSVRSFDLQTTGNHREINDLSVPIGGLWWLDLCITSMNVFLDRGDFFDE